MHNNKTHLIIIEKFGKYSNKLNLAMKANKLNVCLLKDIYIAAAEVACNHNNSIGSVIGDLKHLKEADNSFIDMCSRRNIHCLSTVEKETNDDFIDCYESIESIVKAIKDSKNNMDVRVTQEEMEALLAS